jgi:hypothetical protein
MHKPIWAAFHTLSPHTEKLVFFSVSARAKLLGRILMPHGGHNTSRAPQDWDHAYPINKIRKNTVRKNEAATQ